MNAGATQRIQHVLRHLRLLGIADKYRYLTKLARFRAANRRFISANPEFKLPPKSLAYDAYSAPNWNFYKQSGIDTAKFLVSILETQFPDLGKLTVLEWGCGPARVIRHLPAAIGHDARIHGSDYNPTSIAWCVENIPGVTFSLNELEPPLSFEAAHFDCIYGISILTHLSETIALKWVAELIRVVRPGGIVVLTTNGDSICKSLLPHELAAYRSCGVVIRGHFKEGKRCFSAIHSPRYARERLFQDFEILQHVPAGFPHTGQDYWILKRPCKR